MHSQFLPYFWVFKNRFGRVMGLKSHRSIKKGEEVYAFYGYLGGPGSPRWYNKALLQKFHMSRMQKSQFYWPVPISHFDRVFCDKVSTQDRTRPNESRNPKIGWTFQKWICVHRIRLFQNPWQVGWSNFTVSSNLKEWIAYAGWKRHQSPWTTGQLWNSINPKKREVYIFLSFLSKQAPMDFTIASSQVYILQKNTMLIKSQLP